MHFDFDIPNSQYKAVASIAFKSNIAALKPLPNLSTNMLPPNIFVQLDIIK